MEKEELNILIYNKLLNASELLLRKESDRNINVIDAFDALNEIVEKEDLNQVSDIHIYEEGFGNLDKKLKDTLVHAITSVIGFEYSDANVDYVEGLVLSDDGMKSDIAFDFLLKLGAYHEKFRDRIFLFIEQYLNVLSKNKLNIIGFYMASVYPKEPRVAAMLSFVIDYHKKKFPNQENEVKENETEVSNPDDKIKQETKAEHQEVVLEETDSDDEKPWWKFW